MAVFPPPMGAYADCGLCDAHSHSQQAQDEQTKRYTTAVNDQNAKVLIDGKLDQTNALLAQIKEKLSTHGDLILSRWSKKSKSKRSSLLEDAFGTILAIDDGEQLWAPWLQKEDLIEDPKKLIALLRVRTAFSLQDWATFDAVESGTSFDQQTDAGPFNPRCVQMCGPDFGRLVGFDIELVHKRVVLGFPRTFFTFCTQSFIARILLTIINAIVADAAPNSNAKWSTFVNSSLDGRRDRLDSY